MRMMRMVIRAMTVTRVMATMITALVSAAAGTGEDSPTFPRRLTAASLKHRRRGMAIPAGSHSIGLIGPQYLPALARARSLRLRVGHLSVITPRRR